MNSINPAEELSERGYVNLYIQCETLVEQIQALPGGTSGIPGTLLPILPLSMEGFTLPVKIEFVRHKKEKLENFAGETEAGTA